VRPREIYAHPARIVKHYSGTATPSGVLVDFRAKLGSDKFSDTIFVQSTGPSGLKVHLDVPGDVRTEDPTFGLGGWSVASGGNVFVAVERQSVLISGDSETFEVLVARRL